MGKTQRSGLVNGLMGQSTSSSNTGDIPGVEERKRQTEVIGLVGQITKSEAGRKKLGIISKLNLNSGEYRIPSSKNFGHAVAYYRTKYAPNYLRDSTFSVADGRIRNHLEGDWSCVPIEHIDIDSVNEWAAKKRKAGLSWTTIKDALRTMQGVLSAFSKDKKPPFSLKALKIPETEKLQLRINSVLTRSHYLGAKPRESLSKSERLAR